MRITPLVGRRAAVVLAATGALGLVVGGLLRPSWQDVVEPAQVLAGVVSYPIDHPQLLYATKTWTLLHQIPAALLWMGVSERATAILVSGAVGALAFQALGLTVWAISGRRWLSVVAPLVILLTSATEGGVSYPILLVGTIFTSGTVGLALMLLMAAAFGAGELALGALILGVLPAVHPVLGAWCLAAAVIAAWWERSSIEPHLRRMAAWCAAGLAISVASAAVHFARFALAGPSLSAADAHAYLNAAMLFWDDHRRPFLRLSIQAAPAMIGLATCLLWIVRGQPAAPGARRLLRIIAITALLGLALSVVLAIDPFFANGLLWRAMPSRLMNLPGLAAMAILIGLGGRYARDRRAAAVLAALVAVCMAIAIRPIHQLTRAPIATFPMLFAAAIFTIAMWRGRLADSTGPAPRWLAGVVIGVTLTGLAGSLASPGAQWRRPGLGLSDRTNDEFLAAVAARPGAIITGGRLHLVQLVTRRPVVLDGGAIDALPYVLAAAPAMEHTLDRIYGIRLMAPPFSTRDSTGSLPEDAGRDVWEARPVEDWRAIGREFGATDVLTEADWVLRLPVAARNGGLVLYAIPR